MLLLAVGLASGFSAAVSALVSAALAGWSLAPLTRLTERVEHVSTDSPAAADLGEPGGSPEVEALRETIQRLLGRLGESLERSRTFASGAAHELRTPLATMMAELDLVTEGAPESVTAPLGRVRRTLDRLAVLVERLLGLAAGDRAQMAQDTVALEDVVSDVLASRLDRERARIEAHLDDQGMVRGDEALLRTVVDNLLDNALKFSVDRPVQVRVEARGSDVLVLITDQGPGIDPAEAARLLRAFERGASANAPGFGLGLAIAAHAVRLHGGELRLSMLARGTEARVRLPAWSPAA
ncbi:MAG: HAMP domain-containing histidine kinase [Myxococcales bacterium]|nr:MAG: HAMP domain-containing histidine kinase [Myxococcales bacterium]